MKRSSSGQSMVELLMVLAIMGTTLLIGIPHLWRLRERAAVRAVANEVRSVLANARSHAIAHRRNTAVKFLRFNGQWQYAIYEDGNWNGVRNNEIASGRDPLLKPYSPLVTGSRAGRIGLPSHAIPDPVNGAALAPGASPIRFNDSALCSFSPRGSATSGTVFLTDGSDTAAALVVYGPSARIRFVVYDGTRWRRR